MQNQKSKIKNSLKAISYKLKAGEGFTLMESLVAIAVFTVGVSAAIFVIQQSFSVGARVKNKIIAGYLAQEGIEVMRNIRDRNWIEGRVFNVDDVVCVGDGTCWTNGINDSDGNDDFTKIGCAQYDDNALFPLSNSAKCPGGAGGLSFSGSYYDRDSSGKFERVIKTEYIQSAGDEPEKLKVISKVDCGAGCSIALEEYLYNWK